MTIYGIDISEWQENFNFQQAEKEGIKFAILRTNDGTYADKYFQRNIREIQNTTLRTAAYVYMRPNIESSIQKCIEQLRGRHIPVWLDFEAPGMRVTQYEINKAKTLLERAGHTCAGIYSYVPYWEAAGDPPLGDLSVWVAAYPNKTSAAPHVIYSMIGADHAPQWTHPLSWKLPKIWQFTDRAQVAGQKVDCNAFRGTLPQLDKLFATKNTPKKPKDNTMKNLHSLLKKTYQFSRLTFEQLAGYKYDKTGKPQFSGWPFLGNRTIPETLAAIAEKLDIEDCYDPKKKN